MDLKFEFSFKTEKNDSFRTQCLVGQYDLEQSEIVQRFSGNYKLPEEWNVGLIVGGSGTGKTSIARKVFGDLSSSSWDGRSVIESFREDLKMEEITNALGSVGFNSVPYWLKPFEVLSNGEKSRVELARLCLEKDLVVYDEFTSLVDRDVAKSMSNSVGKLFRRMKKRLVAVTCHKDILEWLSPDWVYDTDEKRFYIPKGIEGRSSNLRSTEQIKNSGAFIKSITI